MRLEEIDIIALGEIFTELDISPFIRSSLVSEARDFGFQIVP